MHETGQHNAVIDDLTGLPDEKVEYTKRGTIRKRKQKQPIVYFTSETEEAIIAYVASNDQNFRDKIYREKIEYAFFKLAENIIHTFKFYYTDVDTVNHLKHEVITFLLEKMHLYNQSKGKAYSYFGTIVKRYLIIYNEKNYSKLKEKAILDEVDEDKNVNANINAENTSYELSKFMKLYIKYIDKNIYTLFPKQADAKIADSIMQLFKNCETLEEVNKKALYIYIREMHDAPTVHITSVINKLKKIYRIQYNMYYDKGYIEI